ncbi:MAG: tetratricopeptide repeat protein [Acidobacteriota bacterium]
MTIVRSFIKNPFFLFLLVALPAAAPGQSQTSDQSQQQAAPAQQQPEGEQAQSQEGDVRYTAEEYAAYQKATEEPDPVKREDAILDFVKNNPKSSLVEYALTTYKQLLVEYQKSNNWQRMAVAGEKLLAIRPDDVQTMYLAGTGCFYTQQYPKAAQYLEKVYASQPEPAIAFMLAVIYGTAQTNDDVKLLKYGEIACSKFEPKDCYQILPNLTRIYMEKKQWAKGADNAKKTLQAFELVQKPPTAEQAAWDDYIARERAVAYSALGRQSFDSGNMKATISNYKQTLKAYSKNPGLNAEAYYHIGYAMWKLDPSGVEEGAMIAFAKGAQQKGAPHQQPCQKELERLYKVIHNGSLAGLDEFVDEAVKKPLPS